MNMKRERIRNSQRSIQKDKEHWREREKERENETLYREIGEKVKRRKIRDIKID
jgi:hypothetical protein